LQKSLQLRDRALILFLLDTGVRASELCDLTVADVDLATGTARVRGKGHLNAGAGKLRLVRLGKRTRHALWLYLADRAVLATADAPVFATRAGETWNRIHLRTHLHRLGLRADVARCYPHRFRHTFALNYLRNGGDIYTLQQQLGHSSLEMVRRYLALAQADAEAAHRRASPVDHWRL
jgi:integrase/recombinase XerD